MRFLSIDAFIKIFKEEYGFFICVNNKNQIEDDIKPTVDFFTNGYCYHFARILQDSFPGGRIFIDIDLIHAIYFYEGEFYDITGRITDKVSNKRLLPIEYLDYNHLSQYILQNALNNGFNLEKALDRIYSCF